MELDYDTDFYAAKWTSEATKKGSEQISLPNRTTHATHARAIQRTTHDAHYAHTTHTNGYTFRCWRCPSLA